MAEVTKCHRVAQTTEIDCLTVLESKIKVSAGLVPSEVCEGASSVPLPLSF